MPDFTITDEIISKIAKQYSVKKERIEVVREFYKKFSGSMKQQYLAHVIRTMEDRLRVVTGNEMFRIICSPVAASSPELGLAKSQYYPGRFFAIYYHPSTNEKQLRVLIAHELGHLFLVELANSIPDTRECNEGTETEPLSSILGIFIIMDKNEFYHNKTVPYKHTSPDEVLKDFSLMEKRSKNIFNVS